MSLFSRIPTTPVSNELPFLARVDFGAYAHKMGALQLAVAESDAAAELSAPANGCTNGHVPLIRMVGFQDYLNELRMVLGAASLNNAWISGPRGIGKTSLIEALMRLRATKRLSSQMLAKPTYFFDVSAFFKLSPDAWVGQFNKAMEFVVANKGLLVVDHMDDFVRMAGPAACRMVNALVSSLENNETMQAIIISESDHKDAILQASSGIDRRFQEVTLDKELSSEDLKPVLIAQFRNLERVHNVDYTEEAADEIIRILSRYPGRAFPGARPRNAVTFADKVGTFVRLGKYAEPPSLAELREKEGRLTDRRAVLQEQSEEDKALGARLDAELAEVKAAHAQAEAAWRQRFAPLFSAQDKLADTEGKISLLQAKDSRTDKDEEKLSLLKAVYKDASCKVDEAERQLYPTPPRVTAAHVRQVFSMEAGVPLADLSEDKVARLAHLDEALDAEIFLQSTAKQALARVYREREMGVSDPSRPAGVLLFTGGSGLGKTELVKALARFDGGEAAEPVIIRLSEFKSDTAPKKLLGADPGYAGYDEGSPFLDPVEKNPRALVLFDEADKAHPSVFDVLMQVLEEGKIRNSKGKLIDFKDTIIVIATNLVRAEDLDPADQGDDEKIRARLLDMPSKETGDPLFRPEFLSRVDEVVLFENLGKEEARKILQKEMGRINRDYHERGIEAALPDDTARALIDRFYNPAMGGRSLRQMAKKQLRPLMVSELRTRFETKAKGEAADLAPLAFTMDGETLRLARAPSSPPRPAFVPAGDGQERAAL